MCIRVEPGPHLVQITDCRDWGWVLGCPQSLQAHAVIVPLKYAATAFVEILTYTS